MSERRGLLALAALLLLCLGSLLWAESRAEQALMSGQWTLQFHTPGRESLDFEIVNQSPEGAFTWRLRAQGREYAQGALTVPPGESRLVTVADLPRLDQMGPLVIEVTDALGTKREIFRLIRE